MRGLTEPLGAVGFDLDGTLIDSAPDIAAAANAMLEALGLRTLPASRFPALIGAGVDQLVLRALEESLGSAPAATQQAHARALYGKLYQARLYQGSNLYPGVVAGLHALYDAQVPLCCITNKAAEFVEPVLEITGLHPYFEFTLSPQQEDERKPSPAMLLAACRRMAIEPRNFVYVGDSHTDILAARAAHCRAVVVSYGYHQGSLADLEADAVIGSLLELRGPPPSRTSVQGSGSTT